MTIFFSALCLIIGSLLSILLSASETSITMASRFRLQQMAKKGHEKASLLLSLQSQLNIMIGTILLGNTCLFSGMTTIVNSIASQHFGTVGLIVSPLLMGTFITIYLEVIPKIYAAQAPEKVGLALAGPVSRIKWILTPITWVMDWLVQKTIRMIGIKGDGQRNPLEELHGAIDLYTGDGKIVQERAMLRRVLDLSQIHVDEIMIGHKKIKSLSIDQPEEVLREKILAFPYTHVPLWKETPQNIIGILKVKNFVRNLHHEGKKPLLELIQKPFFASANTSVFEQMEFFKSSFSHQAFITDEKDKVIGLITLEDILLEIIRDAREDDEMNPIIQPYYDVEGGISLKTLKRKYNFSFETIDGVSTLSGLILHERTDIPEIGNAFEIQNMMATILEAEGEEIIRVRLTKK